MAIVYRFRFRVRRRTTANWVSSNGVLLDSEIGLESDLLRRSKMGNGVDGWNDLPFYTPGMIDQTALAAIADGDTLVWDASAGMFVPGAGGGSTTLDGGIVIHGGSPNLILPLSAGDYVTDIVPANYQVTDWELLVYPSGTMGLDVLKSSSIGSAPTSILPSSGGPAVAAGTTATGSAAGWSTDTFAQSNVISVSVDYNDTVKWFSLLLKGIRT